MACPSSRIVSKSVLLTPPAIRVSRAVLVLSIDLERLGMPGYEIASRLVFKVE